MALQEHSDHELVQQYLKGDERSLEVLIQRYVKPIYGFVFGYVHDKEAAEDIAQETFLKVWKNAKTIDKNKNFKSWLYTIAKNTTFDFLKKKKAIPFSRFENEEGKNYLTENLAGALLLPSEISEARELSAHFAAALQTLSEKYTQVLSLYYYNYLNFREIAEFLQEPINTVKSRHRRGLALLQRALAAAPNGRFYS